MYSSFEELGLSFTKGDIVDIISIVNAMSNRSILIVKISYVEDAEGAEGADVSQFPHRVRTLTVTKLSDSRCYLDFITRTGGININDKFFGNFYQGNWSGWKQFATTNENLIPSADNTYNLGSSTFRWKNIFGASGSITTSDKCLKDKIKSLSFEKIRNFIMSLNPVSYEFTDNGKEPEERRTHWGLISQEVLKAMYENGLNTLDFAGLIISPITKEVESGEYIEKTIKDETDEEQIVKVPVMKTVITGERYGLRYEEFIAPMLKMLQTQQIKIEEMEATITSLQKAK